VRKISICTGLDISALILGADSTGFSFDKENTFSMIDRYLDSGGNMIDTAHLYGISPDGETQMSEKMIGRYLRERKNRDRLLIATKGGHPPVGKMSISRLSREEIFSDMEESLSYLGIDYVDLYWLHRDDECLPVGPIMEAMHELVKNGKTRFFGVSNWRAARIEEANAYAAAHGLSPIAASQIQYSFAHPNYANLDPTIVPMDEVEYEYYRTTRLPVFAFASQAKGYFSKMSAGGEEALSEKCVVRYHNDISVGRWQRACRIGESVGADAGQVALAALMQRGDFSTIPLLGCRTLDQLENSLAACNITLTPEQLHVLYQD